MKIAIVTHNVVRGDGQGRVNLEIARHALDTGHRVSLLADAVDQEIVDAGAEWIPVQPRISRPNLVKGVRFASMADRVLRQRRNEFDAIIGNGFTLTEPHQLNISHFVHGTWIHSPYHVSKLTRGPRSWYQRLYTTRNAVYEKKSYAAAQAVVAVSRSIKDELIQIGLPAEKIHVVYNGVDLQEFAPGLEDSTALKLPDHRPLALFVGDIRTPRKNLGTTLKAVAKVPNVHLAVAGTVSGSPFPELARQLGIESRVTFLDFRRDIASLMRAADLLVFPSHYDTFGLVALEALACGTPVITARSVGASEIMTPECGAVLENPDDVDGLAAAIRKFADDPAARSAAGKAARLLAEQFGWARMAQACLDLITTKDPI